MATDHSIGDTRDAGGGSSTLPWVVLVVDDEPEVIEVTELLLGDTRFRGRPLEILGASSAEEARRLLVSRHDTALVLLDVVMESEDAGLVLTEFIRDDLGDEDVQIILRTGQPGSAPEQDVILNHDINGYFLKSEITAQKLRSVVIGALRNYGYIKKLRPTGYGATGRQASVPRAIDVGTPQPPPPDLDSDSLVLSAEPLVQLHDQAWSALQLGTRPSLRTEPNFGAASGGDLEADGDMPGIAALRGNASVDNRRASLQIDTWLLRRACELASQMHARGTRPVDIIVPIASSGSQLARVPGALAASLKQSNVPADRLVLELSEAALVLDRESAGRVVTELVDCGVRIALVHSAISIVSLRRLRDIRPSILKIPRELVRDLSNDGASAPVDANVSTSATMVRAIIALAHTFGMSVAAEGVGTRAELEFLRWEGCDLAQGTLVSNSLPEAEALRLFGMPTGTTATH